jgi:hypothetical protein
MNLHNSIFKSKTLSYNQNNLSSNGFKLFSLSKNFQSFSSINDSKVLPLNKSNNKSTNNIDKKFELIKDYQGHRIKSQYAKISCIALNLQ